MISSFHLVSMATRNCFHYQRRPKFLLKNNSALCTHTLQKRGNLLSWRNTRHPSFHNRRKNRFISHDYLKIKKKAKWPILPRWPILPHSTLFHYMPNFSRTWFFFPPIYLLAITQMFIKIIETTTRGKNNRSWCHKLDWKSCGLVLSRRWHNCKNNKL